MSEGGTATGGTWNQIVPELYYDLLGRIPAGIVFWILVGFWSAPALSTPEVRAAKLEHVPFGLLFAVLLVLSYIVGIVIVPLS